MCHFAPAVVGLLFALSQAEPPDVYFIPGETESPQRGLGKNLAEKPTELRGKLWADPTFLVLEVNESI